jgi:hypothetical protein
VEEVGFLPGERSGRFAEPFRFVHAPDDVTEQGDAFGWKFVSGGFD